MKKQKQIDPVIEWGVCLIGWHKALNLKTARLEKALKTYAKYKKKNSRLA